MMRCSSLKEYVFGLLDYETGLMKEQYSNLYREFGSLIITDNSFEEIVSFEGLLDKLEAEYISKIKNQTFSKEFGQWGVYSSSDRKRLGEVNTE